jgi:ATP-dependent DNA helicase RecG
MLEIILETIEKVGNRVGNLTNNQMMILEMIQNNPKASAKILANEVGISSRKIEENIAKLKKQNIIRRVGSTRGYWEII